MFRIVQKGGYPLYNIQKRRWWGGWTGFKEEHYLNGFPWVIAYVRDYKTLASATDTVNVLVNEEVQRRARWKVVD